MEKPQHFGNNACQAERQQREAEEAARQVWDSHVSSVLLFRIFHMFCFCFLPLFSQFARQPTVSGRWRRRKGKQRKLPGMPTQTFSDEICIQTMTSWRTCSTLRPQEAVKAQSSATLQVRTAMHTANEENIRQVGRDEMVKL